MHTLMQKSIASKNRGNRFRNLFLNCTLEIHIRSTFSFFLDLVSSSMPLFPLNNINLSDIRLIASDVDGTLTQNGKFSSDFISTLLDLQSAGIKVLLVTGRSGGWVSALVNYLPVAGAITENGGIFL